MNKSLVLTGMMGVGKSTIGRILAKRLKIKFIDVDKIIEKNERKKTIIMYPKNKYAPLIDSKISNIKIDNKISMLLFRAIILCIIFINT